MDERISDNIDETTEATIIPGPVTEPAPEYIDEFDGEDAAAVDYELNDAVEKRTEEIDAVSTEPTPTAVAPTPVKKKRKKRRKIHEISLNRDIKYRGPLSYRHIRALAWILIAASQAGAIMVALSPFDAGFARDVGSFAPFLSSLSAYATPLFMFAAFAIILNKSRKFSSMLFTYGFFAVVFYCLFLLIHERYMVGLVIKYLGVTKEEAVALIDMFLVLVTKNGYFAFNIFVDLFLCTLFTYFVAAKPKKIFVGKKLIIFRLLAILPALYEIGSIIVKALATLHIITLTAYVYPLLTTKPPLTFLIFVALAFFLKFRSRVYKRRGKTQEDYDAFLKTKANSLHFSIYASIVIVVVGILDLILLVILAAIFYNKFPGEDVGDQILAALNGISSWGIGKTGSLILIIPILFLFSYSKSYKDNRLDIILPILGVILVVLVYVETTYQILYRLPELFKKLLSNVFK